MSAAHDEMGGGERPSWLRAGQVATSARVELDRGGHLAFDAARGELEMAVGSGDAQRCALDRGVTLQLSRWRERKRLLKVWPVARHALHVSLVVGGHRYAVRAGVPRRRVGEVLLGLPWQDRSEAVEAGALDALCALVAGLVAGGATVARWSPDDAIDPRDRTRRTLTPAERAGRSRLPLMQRLGRRLGRALVPWRVGRAVGRLAAKLSRNRLGRLLLEVARLAPVYFVAVMMMAIASGFLLAAAGPSWWVSTVGGVAGGLGAGLVFAQGLGPSGGEPAVGLPGMLCFPLVWIAGAWPPALLTLPPMTFGAVARWALIAAVVGAHAVARRKLEATS